MRDPQGGLLASISGVTGADRLALDQGLRPQHAIRPAATPSPKPVM